jgi:hypothetical protein
MIGYGCLTMIISFLTFIYGVQKVAGLAYISPLIFVVGFFVFMAGIFSRMTTQSKIAEANDAENIQEKL